MLKEVNSLLANGYIVKVFYSYWADWATTIDAEILRGYKNGVFFQVGGDPYENKVSYFFSRVLQKVAWYFQFFSYRQYALARTTYALTNAALGEKADLYIAHNLGALPAAAKAAIRHKVSYGFDAEDFHRGEFSKQEGAAYELTMAIEKKYLPLCTYITASSPMIGAAYKKVAGRKVTVLHNVFSKIHIQEFTPQTDQPLRIFWFSQTIGPERGLELIIKALNQLPKCDISLHLLGSCSAMYRQQLKGTALRPDKIYFMQPVHPDEIFNIAAKFDIGLAAEDPATDNRNFCLTNKLFAYLISGNFILASNTTAQEQFLLDYPGVGAIYESHDINTLTFLLEKLYSDRSYLNECRKKSIQLATNYFNWEHESGKLLSLVEKVLSGT